jgi:hypothetical protein
MGSIQEHYSSREESARIVGLLCSLFDPIGLPTEARTLAKNVVFKAERDQPIFPIPFKETETTAALKAIEGSVASLLAATQENTDSNRQVTVSLEKTTAFLFQAYLATVGGLGKLDKSVRSLLKGKQANEAAKRANKELVLMIMDGKIPICCKLSQIRTAACRQICTRLQLRDSITTFMDRSRLPRPWDSWDWSLSDQISRHTSKSWRPSRRRSRSSPPSSWRL